MKSTARKVEKREVWLDRKKYVILPAADLERLIEQEIELRRMEDQEDLRLLDEFEKELAAGKVEWVSDEEMNEIYHKSPIRIAREKAGLTQAELAKLMDVSQPQVSKWEKVGYNPRKHTLEKICRALKVPLEEVL